MGNAISAAQAGGGRAVAPAACRPILTRVCGLHVTMVGELLHTYTPEYNSNDCQRSLAATQIQKLLETKSFVLIFTFFRKKVLFIKGAN